MQRDELYGQTLPDQVDRIAGLFDAHLGLVNDIHDVYRDRAALEREYASKLQLLVKKATERKNKTATSLVAGENPTKPCSDSIIQQNTLVNAYAQIITSMSDVAQDHVQLADTITSQVTEPLKALERRNDGLKKKQSQFYQKLLSERERFYQERLKNRQKYDSDCAEVDVYRQKQAQQDRHADRAARQYEQHRDNMHTSKNVYLVSIAVANRVKDKFYADDLPNLEDSYQKLQTRLVENCTRVLLQAQTIQVSHQEVLKDRLASVTAALDGIQPQKDQNLFIDLNIRPFTLPTDWGFEPCTTHYDTDEICLESSPKVFLQNMLARSRRKLQELGPALSAKRGEVEKYSNLIASYSTGDALGNIDDAVNDHLDTQHQVTYFATSELVLRTEIDTITAALGGKLAQYFERSTLTGEPFLDDQGGSKPHDFKSSSFSIPTACGYCKTSIWGLSKLGKTCRSCGFSVHAKCELKVPAECTGVRGDHKVAESLSRTSSTISRKEGSIAYPRVAPSGIPSSHSSAVDDVEETPTPTSTSFMQADAPQGHPSARVSFDFSASSPFELSITEGTIVRVVEEDDGSGWVKVTDNHGGKGLVPASYLEIAVVKSPKLSGGSERPQAPGQIVRVIYDYEAQGPDELSIKEGEVLELSSGPYGGQNRADGWWEGYSNDGMKGIFPSNYVELA
ncbi:hypothetical protein L210DRAFT_3447746 [Boletus edulis BED1]|uniref:Uncharacterized protein n=1 Tax=Boletus edulis BED1 TaxID=1328754 RepID=A0AAD4GFE4_BOLED|nr:hypothetical protein L210DRAFT_3447746 [Boletus edulis BED1]